MIKSLFFVLAISLPLTSYSATNYLMWQIPPSSVNFPVYVYDGTGSQVGYIYSDKQQAFLGAYSSSSNYNYTLYYSDGTNWNSCTVVITNGSVNNGAGGTTCPGAVIKPPTSSGSSVSNVYYLALGSSAFPTVSSKAPSPAPSAPNYAAGRRFKFINNTSYANIQIGMVCTQSANPNSTNCSNTENLAQIPQGGSFTFVVDQPTDNSPTPLPGLNSFGFHMSAYQKTAQSSWITTGGYSAGGTPYATKIEPTVQPVTYNSNNLPIPAGPTNLDVSMVDGYNINVKMYPKGSKYCTYTVPPESSNILGAGLYSSNSVLANMLIDTPRSVCKNSSQLPPGQQGGWNLSVKESGGFKGCRSPCSYATKKYGTKSNQFMQMCCPASSGYGPTNCPAANTSWVSNLASPQSQSVYRFQYDDAASDYACPADSEFRIEFNNDLPA